MPDPVPDTAMRTWTGKVIQGLSNKFTDTAGQVIMIPVEAILDNDIGIIATITGVAHDAPIPHTVVIAIDLTVTLHIVHTVDYPCTEAHHTTPEIETCHVHDHPTNSQDEIHIGHTGTPVDHEVHYITRRSSEWKLKIHIQITIALMTILVTQDRKQTI